MRNDNDFLVQLFVRLSAEKILIVGPLTPLKDGSDSPVYVDMRAPLLDKPDLLREFGKRFAHFIYATAPEDHQGRLLVCGVPEAANPLATATVLSASDQLAPITQIIIRGKPKEYGTGQKSWIIGEYRPGDILFLIDDVITTSASKREAIEKLVASGFPKKAIRVVVAFDRQQGGLASLERDGYQTGAIFRILEVAASLRQAGNITEQQEAAVQQFIAEHQHE